MKEKYLRNEKKEGKEDRWFISKHSNKSNSLTKTLSPNTWGKWQRIRMNTPDRKIYHRFSGKRQFLLNLTLLVTFGLCACAQLVLAHWNVEFRLGKKNHQKCSCELVNFPITNRVLGLKRGNIITQTDHLKFCKGQFCRFSKLSHFFDYHGVFRTVFYTLQLLCGCIVMNQAKTMQAKQFF